MEFKFFEHNLDSLMDAFHATFNIRLHLPFVRLTECGGKSVNSFFKLIKFTVNAK